MGFVLVLLWGVGYVCYASANTVGSLLITQPLVRLCCNSTPFWSRCCPSPAAVDNTSKSQPAD